MLSHYRHCTCQHIVCGAILCVKSAVVHIDFAWSSVGWFPYILNLNLSSPLELIGI